MDSIMPTHKILKFRPNTLFEIRKMYNLDKPGQMDEAINLLEDWLKKHEFILKKDYTREYLERAIIFHKGSIARAKSCIEQLCIFKTLVPNYFDKYDAKENFEYFKSTCSIVALPNLTVDNYRVILLKLWNNDFTSNMFYDCYKFGGVLCEYLLANDYAVGGIAVIDDRDVKIPNLLSAINLVHLSHTIAILMKGYGFRLKSIHFVSSSKTIELLTKMIKKIVTEKISNRLFVHTELETLYEHVPKEILTVELNGNERSISVLFDEWLDLMSTKENVEFIEEMFSKAVADKSYKQVASFNETYDGLEGTFRNLSVD